MKLKPELSSYVDGEGRLVLPPEVASRHGLNAGVRVLIDEAGNDLRLRKPVTHLAKVYIEPTNRCNLECRTCIRNAWNEPLGQMSKETFSRIIEGLKAFSSSPTVFFGGFGEPLAHPDIADMVTQAKNLGGSVELITNGTLLTKDLTKQLIDAGLDMLWVSLDGAKPESYADVRLGAALPEVISNLKNFRDACPLDEDFLEFFFPYPTKPKIGIVFVAMKRNIADLPSVVQLGSRSGAMEFLITNLLPYTPDMCDEVLYRRSMSDGFFTPSAFRLQLPKIDVDTLTREALYWVTRSGHSIWLAGRSVEEITNRCPFIEKGAAAISWEGNVSPCLPLLHSHRSYVDDRERFSKRYPVGNVIERDLNELWNLPEYLAFRKRVQEFEFSPCVSCGGCDLFEKNEEDCFGNTFPTCGGCLWAQGIIQCP
jgi:MoaA/NifB/PqqE/SkfB family radical SAM enzyme